MRNLRSAGLVGNQLFKVEGDLVGNYNRVLEKIIGKKTDLKSFSIDKRGISPEIEEEETLGRNYLQCGPANRYMIVISPDQKDAELLDEEFSFDNSLFDSLYQHFLPGIATVTRVDGLYGRINTRLDTYDSLDDLLVLRGAGIELHTPSNFITNARKLQIAVRSLENDPNLLVKNDSEIPKKILELVAKVGDIRGYNINNFSAFEEVISFATRLFDGVYVFREIDSSTRRKLKRPDAANGDQKDLALKPIKTTVIYNQTNGAIEGGPLADFIPVQSTQEVINFLIDKKYAGFSEKLIEPRLSCLEDLSLLGAGYDVVNMPQEQRMELLSKKANPSKEWKELKSLQSALMKGYDIEGAFEIRKTSTLTKAMLLENTARNIGMVPTMAIVASLLTKLWPWDLPATYQYNKGDLEILFDKADDKTQNYIVHVLKNQS